MTQAAAPAAGVTQAEFARQCGYAKSYVTALKKAGRLAFTADGKVDVLASIKLVADTKDPNRDDVAARHAAARGTAGIPTPGQAQKNAASAPPAAAEAATTDPGDGLSYQAARTLNERYKALTSRLDYNKAAGLVIDRVAVASAIEDLCIALRQTLEQQPNRLAPELLGQDIDTIRNTLKRETASALRELAAGFKTRLHELANPDAPQ